MRDQGLVLNGELVDLGALVGDLDSDFGEAAAGAARARMEAA